MDLHCAWTDRAAIAQLTLWKLQQVLGEDDRAVRNTSHIIKDEREGRSALDKDHQASDFAVPPISQGLTQNECATITAQTLNALRLSEVSLCCSMSDRAIPWVDWSESS